MPIFLFKLSLFTCSLKTGEQKQLWNCSHCQKTFRNPTFLRRHMSRLHRNDTKGYHSHAIDINNGIFMAVKKSTGLVSPIHVQKSIKLQKFVCTNQSCSDMMNAAEENCPGTECQHLEAIKFSQHLPNYKMKENCLQKMFNIGLISKEKKNQCIDLQNVSKERGVPLVVYANFGGVFGLNKDWNYYSVLTFKKHYFAKLERVRVTYDKLSEKWSSCLCPVSNVNRLRA